MWRRPRRPRRRLLSKKKKQFDRAAESGTMQSSIISGTAGRPGRTTQQKENASFGHRRWIASYWKPTAWVLNRIEQ